MSNPYEVWNPRALLNSDGVIVGCQRNQEWLLPWWWMHFRLYNNCPVTFINFGDMSPRAVRWCSDRGELFDIEIPPNIIASKDKIDPETAKLWESMNQDLWIVRPAWYKKSYALIKTPYERTVWMDLDCQVRGSITPLFETCENDAGIAMAKEADWQQALNLQRKMILPGQYVFNAGVICFRRGAPVLSELVKQIPLKNHLFFGDQHLLIHILYAMKLPFATLSPLYNWTVDNGANIDAVILHWVGAYKEALKQQINFLQNGCLMDFSLESISPDPIASE